MSDTRAMVFLIIYCTAIVMTLTACSMFEKCDQRDFRCKYGRHAKVPREPNTEL